MATVILNPNGILSADGFASGGSTASELAYNETSNAWTTNNGATAKTTVTLENFDSTGVASITSVRHTIVAYYANARVGFITGIVKLQTGSGTLWSENESVTVNGGNFATYSGTAQTTSDGSSAWTDGDLDDLRLHVTLSLPGPGNGVIQQAYVTVVYQESGYSHKVNGTPGADISSIKAVPGANIGTIIGVG